MSNQTAPKYLDQLREELSRLEAELTYRQANGEPYDALHEQVLALRTKLAAASP